jgi:putative transposase
LVIIASSQRVEVDAQRCLAKFDSSEQIDVLPSDRFGSGLSPAKGARLPRSSQFALPLPWRPQQVLSYLANYTHRVALSNRRIVAVDARHQTATFTYRDYRHGSQRKELTLSALEFIRRFSLHILPPGLVRIRHYGILGNNRRKRDIEAARAICKSSGCALELQPRSVADPPCGAMCCPSCGKAGIRLVAFTDAAGVLHIIGAGPMPFDSS